MHITNKRTVLLLDRDYLPVGTITWKRAMKMIYGANTRAEVVALYNDSKSELDPSVIKLLNRSCAHLRRTRIRFTRRRIMMRDNHRCVYCGSTRKLTIDHVLPRSRGGKNTYLNCVTACVKCNQSKGDKTPEEWGKPLKNKPKIPMFGIVISEYGMPQEWRNFIWE